MKETNIPVVAKTAFVIGVAVLAFVLGKGFSSGSSESPNLNDLVDKNRAEMEALKGSVHQLADELKASTKELKASSKPDSNEQGPQAAAPSPSGTDGKLGRLLVTDSAIEKQKLAEERIGAATSRTKLTFENVHVVASDLQAMNAILTSPEKLDSSLLDRVEKERDRLLEMLRTQIPPLVTTIDEQAIKEQESKEALGLWAKGGAVLGYYPSSNIPKEAEAIQKIVTEHETVRTRLALLQKQRYNIWACVSIKKAWQDFSDPNVSSSKAKLETCKEFLGPIETSHLEPITMELYRDFLDAIKKKVSSEEYQSLAATLANAKRRMPGEVEHSK